MRAVKIKQIWKKKALAARNLHDLKKSKAVPLQA
jgi:hypothetical protein